MALAKATGPVVEVQVGDPRHLGGPLTSRLSRCLGSNLGSLPDRRPPPHLAELADSAICFDISCAFSQCFLRFQSRDIRFWSTANHITIATTIRKFQFIDNTAFAHILSSMRSFY
eukprot:scaffold275560_cov23-Prasinocladus_malaysianus.AAC.1